MAIELTAAQKEQVARFIPIFRRYLDHADQDSDALERQARRELYAQILAPDTLRDMAELELGQVISSLWANRLWGNKSFLVERLIRDNGLEALAAHLNQLLWGRGELARRYDTFRKAIKGLGAASITEILAFVHPESCAIWNDITRAALSLLGFGPNLPALGRAQISGAEYQEFNDLVAALREELETHKLDGFDLLGMNTFLFAVWENGRLSIPPQRERDTQTASEITEAESADTAPEPDFDHDEMVDQLVRIGQWLGFQAEKEKLVARGARVDAVWQTRSANLGVVTYVIEVQRHGSIDSLILNLQRAQNNPTVQRLIVVARAGDIERLRGEIATLPETFRKLVTYMEVREAQRAAELIGELSGIIGKLDLVRSEFGV